MFVCDMPLLLVLVCKVPAHCSVHYCCFIPMLCQAVQHWRCAEYLRINGRYSKLSMVCQESSRCKGIVNKGEETVRDACCPLDVRPQHLWFVRAVGNMVAGLLTSATQIALRYWARMVFPHVTATMKKKHKLKDMQNVIQFHYKSNTQNIRVNSLTT